MIRVALGLGSCLGERTRYLQQAIRLLQASKCIAMLRKSSLYETAPILPENAPDTWDLPYLNMAIVGYTSLPPHALLRTLKEIEAMLGRKKAARWAPRVIDIDILSYGTLIYHDHTLTLPHPELTNRAFALIPLEEVWPNWRHPKNHYTIPQLLEQLGTDALESVAPYGQQVVYG